MPAPLKTWEWTAQREAAASLAADDRLTDRQIAEQVGVSRETIVSWRMSDEFRARIAEHVNARLDACMTEGIADKRNRVRRLSETWQGLQQVIAERAVELNGVAAGGGTGLLVHQVKGIGKGDNFRVVDEYAVDTGLLNELRQIEQQAAKELGQWSEKTEQTGNVTHRPSPDWTAIIAGALKQVNDHGDNG